ncbi:hypothetical protein [Mycolicibacterium sp. HS_4_1]
MQEATGLVAVLGVLMMAYYFILGSRVGVGRVLDGRGGWVSNTTFGGTVGAFLEGIVVVLACAEIAAAGGGDGRSFTAGAFLGGVAVLGLRIRRWWPGRLGYELFYSVLGLVAAIPAIVRLVGAAGCDAGTAQTVRVVGAVMMAATWAAMLTLGLLVKTMSGFRSAPTGLAAFGAVDVIIYLSGPLGDGASAAGAVVLLAAAAAIGAAAAFSSGIVMMACGLFLGFAQLLTVTTGHGAECGQLMSTTPMAMLVGYAVVFWLGAQLVSRRKLRRIRVFGSK